MFRIKASYADQLELRTTLEKAREFFGEIRNFTDLMPGIEGIRKEAGGIMRWMVRLPV
jgi:carbon monoxide dehydrogenase subunit G